MLKKYVYNFGMFGFGRLAINPDGIYMGRVTEFFTRNFGVTPEEVHVDSTTGILTVKANGCAHTFPGEEIIEDDWYLGGYFGSRKNTKKPHKGETGGYHHH